MFAWAPRLCQVCCWDDFNQGGGSGSKEGPCIVESLQWNSATNSMVTTEDKGSVQQLRQRKPIASTAATLGKSPASIILLPECTASCPRVEHGQKVTLAAVSEAGAEATTCSTSAEAMSESDTFSGFQEVDEEECSI
mmetsp:Transcript_113457/g.315947  ORF Transcript_113457/g.315947 Transcript_113457/m.315947 type:complete len:137 (+) Transcript_113457:82-492(+)